MPSGGFGGSRRRREGTSLRAAPGPILTRGVRIAKGRGIHAVAFGAGLAVTSTGACGLATSGAAPGAEASGQDAMATSAVESGSGSCPSCTAGQDATLDPTLRDSAASMGRDVSSSGGALPAEGGGPDGGSLTCDTCVAQACPGAQAACGAGSDCAAYLACLVLCGGSSSSSCSTNCGSQHPAGQQASAMLTFCTILCAASCNSGGSSSSGGPVDSGSADADDAGG